MLIVGSKFSQTERVLFEESTKQSFNKTYHNPSFVPHSNTPDPHEKHHALPSLAPPHVHKAAETAIHR